MILENDINTKDPAHPGTGSALEMGLLVYCPMYTWNSERKTPQLSASEGAGRKARATPLLGSSLQVDASAEIIHPHQKPSWTKVSVI